MRARASDLVAAVGIDALLTPTGLGAAVAASAAPGAAITILAGVFGGMALLARERSNRLEHQERSLRDPLTGLANRARFEELAKAALLRSARTKLPAALLLLDLNDFKPINDQHGHLCGDHVLQRFADRLRSQVRTTDTAARLGGDEFAILLTEPTTLEAAEMTAANLRQALLEPLDIPDIGNLRVSASIGAALLTSETPIEDALSAADHAMYEEKRTRPRNRAQRT